MSNKHTPGPWAATHSDPAEGVDVWWITNADAGNFEKEIGSVAGAAPTSEANARLIAAAPDLLLALKAMAEEWVEYMTINNLGDPWAKHNMKLARAAIAKATGTP